MYTIHKKSMFITHVLQVRVRLAILVPHEKKKHLFRIENGKWYVKLSLGSAQDSIASLHMFFAYLFTFLK